MNRMYFIDKHLRTRQYPNCKTLAQEYQVSEKTIQRDITYMREQLDAPIAYDNVRHGYYYTDVTFYLPMIAFTDQDTLSFIINQRILSQYQDTPIYNDIKHVIDKIMQFIPETNELGERANFLSFQTAPTAPVEYHKFELLQQAAHDERQVKLRYYAPSSDQETERIVNPYGIHQYYGAWYLIGYCLLRKDYRFFALNRILSVEVTETEFYKPDDFNIEKIISDSFHFIRDGQTQHVALKFSAYQARWIRERQWHRTQKITEFPDGSLRLDMDVQGLDDVKRWVLQYGDQVEVIAPVDLRETVINELRQMYQIYTGVMIIDDRVRE